MVSYVRADARVAGWGAVLVAFVIGCGGGDDASPNPGDGSLDVTGHTGTHSDANLPAGSAGTSLVQIRAATQELASGDGTGAFRTTCEFSHMRYDDPIVFPALAGRSHLHTFFGNTMTDAASTAASLRNSGNSTCRGGIVNRTAYWIPTMLDAQAQPVVPQTANFYYKSGYHGVPAATITPFPDGLRMIAGNGSATSEQTDDLAYWTCDQGAQEHVGSIPDCESGDRVLMHVEFPQCWDGLNLDSSDHRSHMAYPEEGACPVSHPVAIPAITFNIPYLVPAEGTRGWRLSSDSYDASKPGGFSAHGDWFDGWDPDIVKVWVERCVNPAMDCHSHLLGDGREIYYQPES